MLRGILVMLVAAGALCASALAGTAIAVDRGKDRPPARLTDDDKAIWMTEWTACWRTPMKRISKILHVPVRSSDTPQLAARKLSKRAVRFLYEERLQLSIAADGCRNGILWRYYHPV